MHIIPLHKKAADEWFLDIYNIQVNAHKKSVESQGHEALTFLSCLHKRKLTAFDFLPFFT